MSTNFAHFTWPTSFGCTILTENLILPTGYNLTLGINPISDSHTDITTGFKKLKSLVDFRLNNSVLVSQSNELAKSITHINNNRVVFSNEPYDFFVGCVFFCKFMAITNKYFDIEFLTIDSHIGDNIQYTIFHPEESGLELSGDFWWNEDSLDTGAGDSIDWCDLDIEIRPGFEPKIIRGGLSEKK